MQTKIKINSNLLGTGWMRDYPDFRDYTTNHSQIKPMISKLKSQKTEYVDLRKWCSPIENQGSIGSCTANAAIGLVEYFEKRHSGKYINASRLFLYKNTRRLLNLRGDTGATIRSTIGALVLFGCPPEEVWPYNIEDFDKDPDAFCYAYAANYKTIKYFRLDYNGISTTDLVSKIKEMLRYGIPSVFGFTVTDSIYDVDHTGIIPFPTRNNKILGGHAICAVGFDDNLISNNNERQSTGAFLIRNSWGTEWGNNGYGWLPYDYVTNGLAVDWWCILQQKWVDSIVFIK